MKIRTVCGNGIGSSLMCATIVKEICEEHGIVADIESIDFNSAIGQKADLYITTQQLADQMKDSGVNIVVIRSYINKRKITEDVLDKIKELL